MGRQYSRQLVPVVLGQPPGVATAIDARRRPRRSRSANINQNLTGRTEELIAGNAFYGHATGLTMD